MPLPLRPALLFSVLAGAAAFGQQSAPADILARDAALAAQREQDQMRSQIADQGAQREKAQMDQLHRFYYEPWLEETKHRQKDLVFPPPLTPALATPLTGQPAAPYPALLVTLVGEPFFMVFGSTYAGSLLNPRQLQRVDRYCESRDRLVGELRAKLASLAPAPAEQRARALAGFAPTQANALRKLEAEAESIRDELSYLDEGRAFLQRRDALDPEEAARLKDYYAAQFAAEYHPGLSLDQRQLLQAVAEEAAGAAHRLPPLPHGYFLPATARIHWPQPAGPGLAERLQIFHTLRQNLVAELTRSITALPGDVPRKQLRKHGADLAAQQAPRFAELHRLAEEIRADLASVPYPDRPVPSRLPAELVRQVGETAVRQLTFQAETNRMLAEFSPIFAPEQLRLGASENGPVIELVPSLEPGARTTGNRAKKLYRLREGNAWLGRQHRELATATEKSDTLVQHYLATLPPAQTADPKALAARLAQTYLQEQTWSRFGDYHTAVLEPGLSPAQRRLLFHAALRDLEKHRLATSH